MNFRSLITFAAAAAAVCPSALADKDTPNIVAHIMADSTNSVVQPAELYQRIVFVAEEEPAREQAGTASGEVSSPGSHQAGFRVQVFSDNNTRTAKNEARAKARQVSSRFPNLSTYVRYTSPYWRLKVGDFRTRQEADEVADQLRKAFPAFSKEIRVVRDRINLSD
ncbi:MAG: SPOR domain-containing protein [Duncaniella sp.]|nr:SPOR domain-containing protein [Duncaniella sp.]MDE6582649.1 SPOR domain-containing protein [Duncaniella sp.]